MPNIVRQYVGARYTVKIYENSLDPSSAEWESGNSWEPLVLVTYNNSSYLSKKEIPSNIGNPASNPSYWVCTGYYNGQIISLQNQIDNIVNNVIPPMQSDISDLLDDVAFLLANRQDLSRRVIVITDSYGKGRGGQTPFTTPLQNYLKVANADYFPLAEGAMGFVQAGEDGHTALQLLTSKSGDITDHDTITDVIFALGINDATSSANDINTAIRAAYNYVRSEYPIAKVHVGYIGYEIRDTFNANTMYIPSLKAYIDTCDNLGIHFLRNVEYVMHNRTFFISDNVHPTTSAGVYLANKIAQAVDFGAADVKFLTSNFSEMDSGTDVTFSQNPSSIDNGITQTSFSLNFGGSGVTFSDYGWHSVAELTNTPPISCNVSGTPTFGAFVFATDNKWHPVQIRIYNRHVEMRALLYTPDTFTASGSCYTTTPMAMSTLYC